MDKIYDNLGLDELQRLAMEAMAIKNPNALGITASPCLLLRKYFDKLHDIRVTHWGNAYPRPFYEFWRQSWREVEFDKRKINKLSKSKIFLKYDPQMYPKMVMGICEPNLGNEDSEEAEEELSEKEEEKGNLVVK